MVAVRRSGVTSRAERPPSDGGFEMTPALLPCRLLLRMSSVSNDRGVEW
jgi:hypothetical protein